MLKVVVGLLVLIVAVAAVTATREPKSGHHARVLLGLFEHALKNNANSTQCPDFFEPKPFDHCCTVW